MGLSNTPMSATHVTTTGRAHPRGRAFGGGCTLEDGSLLLYGGWHPFLGTYNDIWLGHAAGCPTKYSARLLGPDPCSVPSSAVKGGPLGPALSILSGVISRITLVV